MRKTEHEIAAAEAERRTALLRRLGELQRRFEHAGGYESDLPRINSPGPLLKATVIFLAVLAVYYPAMCAEFIWDDYPFLLRNKALHELRGLPVIWSGPSGSDYLPVTLTSLWLEWQMWGAWAPGYHVSNILLHALGAILLWRVLKRLKLPAPWAAALLFAVHPVTVASVAWITERKNTLSMVFYAASLIAYLRFDSDGGKRRYGISLGLFVLALLSKASVVMMPVVLFGCAWWRRGRVERKDWLRALPFFALSGLIGLMTIAFQRHPETGQVTFDTGGLLMRLAPAGSAVWFYLSKILLPINLCPIYNGWNLEDTWDMSLLPMLLLAATFCVLLLHRKGWARPVLFGFGYFVVSLFPVLGLIKMTIMRLSLVTDHLQYVAMIGPIALVTGVAAHGLKKWGVKSPAIRATFLIVPVFVLGLMTWHHARHYRSSETLWGYTLSQYPESYWAYENLGRAMVRQERYAAALGDRKAALNAAITADLYFAERNTRLGDSCLKHGQERLAIRQYRQALKFNSDLLPPMVTLSGLLSEAKDPKLRNPPEALRLAQHACALTARKDPAALNVLAAAHAATGDLKQAAAAAQEALALAVSLGDEAVEEAIRSRLKALESGRLPSRTR